MGSFEGANINGNRVCTILMSLKVNILYEHLYFCDQLFADKTLCKHREHSLSEQQGNKRERAALRSGEGANVFASIALYVHCVHTSKYGCMKSTTGTCMMQPYGSKSQESSKPPHILV